MIVEPKRIDVKCKSNGYYVRWYNDGWHSWYFQSPSEIFNTDGEIFKTTGHSSIILGDNVTKSQLTAIRGILSAKYIELYTNDGWKPATLNDETFQIGKADRLSSSVSFTINAWLKGSASSPKVNVTPIYPPTYDSIKLGLLYNRFVISDSRELSSEGWHVPPQLEWQTLISFSNDYPGGLKEIGFTFWNDPNSSATNIFKFNGRGAGIRVGLSGLFYFLKESCYWGTITEDYNHMDYLSGYLSNSAGLSDNYGMSIRLMKDSTILSHGQTGLYIGNDGRKYRTICIGTQEWLADNLAETKYRNGDLIPEVTNDATWEGLLTGAWCAYNNDHSNI